MHPDCEALVLRQDLTNTLGAQSVVRFNSASLAEIRGVIRFESCPEKSGFVDRTGAVA